MKEFLYYPVASPGARLSADTTSDRAAYQIPVCVCKIQTHLKITVWALLVLVRQWNVSQQDTPQFLRVNAG